MYLFFANLNIQMILAGSFGGGQIVTIDGSGFDPTLPQISICDQSCVIKAGTTPTSAHAVCIVPSHPGNLNHYSWRCQI